MFIIPMSTIGDIKTEKTDLIKVSKTGLDNNGTGFADIFKQLYNQVNTTQEIKNNDVEKLALGEIDNLHDFMINAEKASTALEIAVQTTNKAVSAYNEIMRMQI